MSTIKRNEFISTLMLAYHMASADGDLHPSEKAILVKLFNSLGITKEEMQKLKKEISLSEAVAQVQDEEMQLALVDVLLLVAAADGVVTEEEMSFVIKVMKRINMDPSFHPYFSHDKEVDIESVKANVSAIIYNIRALSA